ncbi:major facilitator superfamily domain-containing protein [Exophiala viscosa]|uniref:major facilitator superfamily domain-containing protein n=1 Tax=Exophiala viscosa TaxID=2486360 RepID=UPI00219FDCA0|nr:major facilitator superfamily domain-containing protein [Exophiala viscosa]
MAADAEKIVGANAPAVRQPVIEMPSEKLATREVDGALAFLRNEADASIAELDEKKLVRRIDWLIMPMLFGVYVLQYIDKSLSMFTTAASVHPCCIPRMRPVNHADSFAVNYANVMGISKDTHMTAAQFSYLATFFYVTFAVFQPVHAYLMQKFPTAQYLGVNVALWGLTLAIHSACNSFGGLIVVRLLLGVFESASAPCLILITGMWYKRAEQPLRVAIWYLGVGAGTIIGALSSFGFQFYEGKAFRSWQIMFLIFGLITIVCGIIVFLFLPNSPMASRFTHEEKVLAIERLRENMTGIENKTFKTPQFVETTSDFRTWLIAVIILAGNVPTGACGTFSSTLIKGFGYTSKQSALLNIPSGAISMISVISASWYAGRFNGRAFGICALLIPGILGGGLMAFLPKSDKAGKLVGIYLTQTFGPNLSIMYSWAAANYAGHTKKISINAIILFAYGASNIIGPLTFTGYTAPQYIPAKVAIMACLSLGVVGALLLRFAYVWENKRRDRLAGQGAIPHIQDAEFMDLTDKQNMEFRYAL